MANDGYLSSFDWYGGCLARVYIFSLDYGYLSSNGCYRVSNFGFEDWMLIRYEILEETFKFQKLKLTCLASDVFNSSMFEAESGLGQNMKVIGNDVI